jgi:hypothetical protein
MVEFKIRVAGTNDDSILGYEDDPIKGFKELGDEYEAPCLSLKLSVGKAKKDFLSLEKAKSLVDRLRRSDAEKNNVDKLQVKGKESEDDTKSYLLDLLQEKVKEKISHDFYNKTMTYLDRQPLLHEAWQRRQDEMLKRFPKP